MDILIIITIVLALLFDFLNGMNDAANSIATVVSTKVLSPFLGVAWAAFFNFAAVFIFGVHVATTIGKGIVDPELKDHSFWEKLPVSKSSSGSGSIVNDQIGPSALPKELNDFTLQKYCSWYSKSIWGI